MSMKLTIEIDGLEDSEQFQILYRARCSLDDINYERLMLKKPKLKMEYEVSK